MIQIAAPSIGLEEKHAVMEVLDSGMLAQGPRVAQLEEDFARYCGTEYAVTVNSGTAALHAALFAAGVGPGDEVITTPFSFIATVNPIIMLGAKPVLTDIDPVTFNLDPKLVEAAITPKTKAILPVHLYGQPYDVDAIQAIAKKHSLIVIEDACQAVGATFGDKKAGNVGSMACFSLYATKNIMSGEGGVVTTNNKEYVDAIKRFRQHGMSGPYQYAHLGFNYRTTDVLAAIAIEQLKKVDGFNQIRQRNAALLNERLQGLTGIVLPTVAKSRTHAYHQYTVRVTPDSPLSRDELAAALREKGVGAGVYYPKGLHTVPHIAAYGYKPDDFPETQRAASEVLSLPVHQQVTEADVETIAKALRDIAHA